MAGTLVTAERTRTSRGISLLVSMVLAVAVALGLPTPVLGIDRSCGNVPALEFVHCPGALPEFKTAILAVHGWHGSCRDTFGQGKESLFQVFQGRRFFDWDCFEYDSLTTKLDKNVSGLHDRLIDLKRRGYEQIAVVTHSTGGILALRVLADIYQKQAWDTIPKVVEIQAWATPIEGLRSTVKDAGWFASHFRLSPETLHELGSGSAYLQDLKSRLRNLFAFYTSCRNDIKGKMETTISFYQGQGVDWVVNRIDAQSAAKGGWYWPNPSSLMSRLVDTQLGHTNVFKNLKGVSLAEASYPQELITYGALLHLKVAPRYDSIFPRDGRQITSTLERAQADVVKGICYYAAENPKDFFDPALGFMARMYDESFPRSSKVDDLLIDNFLSLVQQKAAARSCEEIVPFFSRFQREVLERYDPNTKDDVTKLGHQHTGSVRKVQETARIIRTAVNDCIRKDRGNASRLAGYQSLDEFNTAGIVKAAEFLKSSKAPVQLAALRIVDDALPSLSDQTLARSGLVATLDRYWAGTYDRAPGLAKQRIASIYVALNNRGPGVSESALASLNKTVTYRGAERRMWETLGDDQPVRQLVATIASKPDPKTPQQLTFTMGVVASGGASGKDKAVALAAAEVTARAGAALASSASQAVAKQLEQAASVSKYPIVQSTAAIQVRHLQPPAAAPAAPPPPR